MDEVKSFKQSAMRLLAKSGSKADHTKRDDIVDIMIEMALAGDIRASRTLIEITDGPIGTAASVDNNGDAVLPPPILMYMEPDGK